jgi:hypothetical protein
MRLPVPGGWDSGCRQRTNQRASQGAWRPSCGRCGSRIDMEVIDIAHPLEPVELGRAGR